MQSVSVVVATRNRLSDLYKCLCALGTQIGINTLEVCVVNDAGESVSAVCDQAARRFPLLEVKYENLDRHVGQVEARKIAVEMSAGEFIGFCDDDDRWLPEHGIRLLAALLGDEAQFAFTDAELVWIRRQDGSHNPGHDLDTSRRADMPELLERRPFAWKDATGMLRTYNPVVPSSALFTRGLYDALGGLDARMGHYWDWDFLLSAANRTTLRRVPRCETLYTIHASGQNESAHPERMRPDLLALIEKHGLGELPSSNFARMLDDPLLKDLQTVTHVSWDGDLDIF